MVKKSGKIGQNQENRDKIKFGAYFPSKHGIYDGVRRVAQRWGGGFAKYFTSAPFVAIIEI